MSVGSEAIKVSNPKVGGGVFRAPIGTTIPTSYDEALDAAFVALGYVGDFSAIQWGLQKELGLETIEWGDPDGQGDLKRNNQVAFRAEVVYGWGIADLDAFAKVHDIV